MSSAVTSCVAIVKLLVLVVALASAAPCKCKYQEVGEIPAAAAEKAGSKYYGVDCSTKHDSVKGTVYYKDKTECPDRCVQGCNYLDLEWCYVERGCEGANSYNTTLEGAGDLAYSYDICGNPYCWHPYNWDNATCPGSHQCQAEPDKCKCKFEAAGRIPVGAAAKAGSTTYGVDCKSKHDSVPGTVYYKNDTECPDKCVKGCNYLSLEWCYVERGCTGADHFNTTLEGAGDLAYSYDMCGNPYCWDPYGWDDETCPAGSECAQYRITTEAPTPAAGAGAATAPATTTTDAPSQRATTDAGIRPTLAYLPMVATAAIGLCH